MNRAKKSVALALGLSLVVTMTCSTFTTAQDTAPEQASATVKAADGLESVEFDTLSGTVTVDLPDDMSATDTISGSVIAEPKGETKEELHENEDNLQGYVVEIEETQEVQEPEESKEEHKETPKISEPSKPKCAEPTIAMAPPEISTVPHRRNAFSCYIPKSHKKINVCIKDKNGHVVARKPLSCSPTPPPKPTKCVIPPAGTCGAPLKIVGPCDGRSLTSKVTCNGKRCDTLAESPRKQICKMPKDCPGKCTISVTEGGRTTTAVCMLAPAKTQVARTLPSKPKPAPQPAAAPAKKYFRCTGPTVQGGGSYKENTMEIRPDNVMWFGHSVRDKPGSPLRNSTFTFTPLPEYVSPGDRITINCNLTGSELFWGSANFYAPNCPWFKLLHSPTEGMFDERHSSGTLAYEVVDLDKIMDDYRRQNPQDAAKYPDPSTYPMVIELLLTGPHHPQATMRWTFAPSAPPKER
ncbi:MAG: hypothetical protein K2Y22_10140 [Candidatus Obscuribacterales bacterium]|nr:hypothetical protein [Candidatus Obscuribacterales bacterium]